MKKKLFSLLMLGSLSVAALSAVAITTIHPYLKENTEVAKAEEVSFKSIAWNNIDYANLRPASETNYIPQNGYCIMVSYSSYFSPASSDNFVDNSDYCSHIKINGKPIYQIDGSIVRIASGNLFIYFPASGVSYTSDYFRPTLEIDANTIFYGLSLPYNRFEYCYSIGANNKWEDRTGYLRSDVTYSSIEWNNNHYSDSSYPALGAKNALLLNFSANLSSVSSENGGVFVQDRNLVNTTLGENVLLNDTPFKDINGAEIRYFNTNKLWLYAPNMTTGLNGTPAVIDINSSPIFDSVLPNKSFFFVDGAWKDNIAKATFNKIEWNNIDYANLRPESEANYIPQNGYLVLLGYVEVLSSGTSDNMANSSYSVGSHLLINGVPSKDITDAIIKNYANKIFVYFPDSSITYSNEYYRPTIEIEKGCLFGNYSLPYLKIEYQSAVGVNGKWALPNEAVERNFTTISWNNTDYGYMDGKKGLLLTFDDNLSLSSSEYNGNITNREYIDTDLGHNFRLNGVPFNTIDGAEIKYYHLQHFWIYAPSMTTASDGYAVPHLELITPTRFLDVIIPSISFNFSNNLWSFDSSKHLSYANFSTFHPGYNNLDMQNGYRQTILTFDKIFATGKDNTNLKTIDAEFVNKVTLNGVTYKNVPGIYAIYMGGPYVNLMIREVDLVTSENYPLIKLEIPEGTLLFNHFIHQTTLYLENANSEWMVVGNETVIRTSEEATYKTIGNIQTIVGLSFENRIIKGMYDDLVNQYGINRVSFGTYIVPKSNYLASKASSPTQYINRFAPSEATYMMVENTNKDFTNTATAGSDGYYRFTSTIYNIKPEHYSEGYIGVGYLRVGDRTYYGYMGENATTYYELLVDAHNQGLVSDSKFDSIIELETTSNAYELVDNSVVKSGYTLSYARNGYYQLSTNKNINSIVVDGVAHKVNISSGQNKYFAYYNGVVDFRTSLEMSKGIGEPIYDLFPDSVNSNALYDTASNVSSLNEAFGCDGERIWVDVRAGLASNSLNRTDENGEFVLDPAKVRNLHAFLGQFTSKGITELTCLVSGFAYDYNSPVFLKDGVWYSVSTAPSGSEYHTIIPTQSNETYQKWLNANQSLAYQIAKEFPEFRYIEFLNEIDGGGYQYSPTYVTNGTVLDISVVAGWAMDFCHAASAGIREANSHIRVMSPAFSCLDADNTVHYYNTKNFITKCYEHIENSEDTYTNNWFQVMNLHPYIFPSKQNTGEDSVYLWNTRPYSSLSQRSKIDNDDYDTDWLNYMNYVHNTIMGNHHDGKKSIAITEFGFSDMNGTTDSYWKYINYNNRFNTMAENIMTKINSVSYIETLIWFRVFDFNIGDASSAFGGCFEPNFGLIETNKTLKELGKKLYQLWNNGSTNYSAINTALSNMDERVDL